MIFLILVDYDIMSYYCSVLMIIILVVIVRFFQCCFRLNRIFNRVVVYLRFSICFKGMIQFFKFSFVIILENLWFRESMMNY